MADEAPVVDGEITLDDFNADEKPSEKAESTPAPQQEEEAQEKETKDDSTVATPPDVPTKTETEAPTGDETETAETPQGEKPLAPKSENRFQRLANENRELKQQIEKMTSEVYAPQTVEEISEMVNPETGQPYTVAQAAEVALDQKLQMRDFNTRVADTQSLLGAEAYEVMQELPIFNPDSGQFDEELAGIASQTMEANLIRDPNIPEIDPATGEPTGLGLIVDYKQSPKQIYQTLARIHGVSIAKGQIKGQKDTEKMLANADAPTSAAPPKETKDPLVELWKSDD